MRGIQANHRKGEVSILDESSLQVDNCHLATQLFTPADPTTEEKMRDNKKITLFLATFFVLLTALVSVTYPGEGMWLPHEIPTEVMRKMRKMGLKLDREEIFNSEGTGVANAVVRVGATGCFVSPDGLILTNHHVAFGAVQRISTPEHNYIEEGFLARSREEELPAYGYTSYILRSVEDVTQAVLAALTPGMSPLERYEAIEKRINQIVKESEETTGLRSEVKSFFGGSRYLLYRYLRLRDIRVVYVPSRSIGEYGGDIDNWMWPRHTGDFSFLRAYVAPSGFPADYSPDNVPYKPKRYLKIARNGLKEGDFAIIVGFPGHTDRYLTSSGIRFLENTAYPTRIDLYQRIIAFLEDESKKDAEVAVKVASIIKALRNRLKNNQGILEGFKKSDIYGERKDRERKVLAYLRSHPEVAAKYGTVLSGIEKLYENRAKYFRKDLILDFLTDWQLLLGQAMIIYKWSIEKTKHDVDRDPDYMDSRVPDLKMRLRVFRMSYDEISDRRVLEELIRQNYKLPEDLRIKGLVHFFGDSKTHELANLETILDSLYANTKLTSVEERLRMFELSREELLEEGDPFIALAAGIYEDNEERLRRDKTFGGAMTILMPEWIELLEKVNGKGLYPDANGTMRINYGVVKGYSPRDAVYLSLIHI